jgi:hypothetical protein
MSTTKPYFEQVAKIAATIHHAAIERVVDEPVAFRERGDRLFSLVPSLYLRSATAGFKTLWTPHAAMFHHDPHLGDLFYAGQGEALGRVACRNGRALAAVSGTRRLLQSKPVNRPG